MEMGKWPQSWEAAAHSAGEEREGEKEGCSGGGNDALCHLFFGFKPTGNKPGVHSAVRGTKGHRSSWPVALKQSWKGSCLFLLTSLFGSLARANIMALCSRWVPECHPNERGEEGGQNGGASPAVRMGDAAGHRISAVSKQPGALSKGRSCSG